MQRSKPFKFNDFTGCKIGYSIYSSMSCTQLQMVRSACSAVRPRKYRGRRESTNTQIYVATETLTQWRRLQSKLNLSNDDKVTSFSRDLNGRLGITSLGTVIPKAKIEFLLVTILTYDRQFLAV